MFKLIKRLIINEPDGIYYKMNAETFAQRAQTKEGPTILMNKMKTIV